MFLVDNVVLSENRSWLIEKLGEQRYHQFFSVLSTSAMVSVAYGYYKHGPGPIMRPLPLVGSAVAVLTAATGAVLLSQIHKKPADASCPVETKPGDRGVHRITRHPMLYGVGLLGAGFALLSPYAGRRALLSGPLFVLLGGTHHQDSRHRRGLGGELPPSRDNVTSNIPFMALLQGRQDWKTTWNELDHERAAIAVGMVVVTLGAKRAFRRKV